MQFGRPINIHKIHLQRRHSCLFRMIYKNQNISLEFNYLFTKYSIFKREMICIWRGIDLYAATCFMTLRFMILSSFLSTRNLRIDKNYMLSIFMLSGSTISIFNLTWHAFNIKPCILYQHILMLFNFACFHFYNSFIISQHAISMHQFYS